MNIQSEVGRASHGQFDVAKLNLSFFHCLPVLTYPNLLEGVDREAPVDNQPAPGVARIRITSPH